MKSTTSLALSAALLLSTVYAQSTFFPARPPSIPLAVKSPYMSTWQEAGSDGGNGGYLAGEWPTFWAGQITGWTGIIMVDNSSYLWMGAPAIPANIPIVNQTAFTYTSTRSIFTMNINNQVGMNITFLSPITPNDMKRASIPYSYMDVSVSSLDGKLHSVRLYTDITAEWISGDRTALAQWAYGVEPAASTTSKREESPLLQEREADNRVEEKKIEKRQDQSLRTAYTGWTTAVPHATAATVSTSKFAPYRATETPKLQGNFAKPAAGSVGGVAYHKVYRQTQLEFSEISDQAEWGNWYYASSNIANLTHQSGTDKSVRKQFVNKGFLTNTKDTNYRAIDDNYPVFAFSVDLGKVGSTPVDTLFTLTLAQTNAIQFEGGANQTSILPSLWTSYFSDELQAVSFFYGDYSNAVTMADSFDNQIATDSMNAAGQNYLTITSLAARQTFGAVEFAGTSSTPYLFLKEISSDGNIQTVDIIFPAHPIFLYTNPTLLKMLLDPLFINQEAGNWPYAFSIHDLGSHFPNATGHNDGNAEQQPLEECGNMVLMTLAYAQRANDNAYLKQHYKILKQWNQYLIQEALIPANQISTDDFAGSLANQTNLAIKGIIGIAAMAEIATRAGHPADAKNYTSIAQSYITQWQQLGIAHNANPPHTTLAYHKNNTHGLLYNLYADRELNLNLVPQSVYDMQSTFYPTVARKYGVPLDTRHTYTKDDWQMFVAAISSASTQSLFIADLAKWINETPTNRAMTDLFDTTTGDYPDGIEFTARPAQGGTFALLALQ